MGNVPLGCGQPRRKLTPKPLVQYIAEDNPEYVLFGPKRHVQVAFDEGAQYGEKDDCGPKQDEVIEYWSIFRHEDYGLADYRRATFGGNTLASSWLGIGNGEVLPKLKDAFEPWAATVCDWLTNNTRELVTHEGVNYHATRRVKGAVVERESN